MGCYCSFWRYIIKFAYTRHDDEGVSIVAAAPKAHLEKILGELTDEEYEEHVRQCSIPVDAIHVVKLPDDWEAPERASRDRWHLINGQIVVD